MEDSGLFCTARVTTFVEFKITVPGSLICGRRPVATWHRR